MRTCSGPGTFSHKLCIFYVYDYNNFIPHAEHTAYTLTNDRVNGARRVICFQNRFLLSLFWVLECVIYSTLAADMAEISIHVIFMPCGAELVGWCVCVYARMPSTSTRACRAVEWADHDAAVENGLLENHSRFDRAHTHKHIRVKKLHYKKKRRRTPSKYNNYALCGYHTRTHWLRFVCALCALPAITWSTRSSRKSCSGAGLRSDITSIMSVRTRAHVRR